MVLRGVATWGLLAFTAALASAQGPRLAPAAPDCLDQPTQYPPLLRPAPPDPPLAVVPRGPTGEYDHSLLYLPDYVPPPAPEGCRPLGRWWVSPTLEFAWLPSKPAPGAVQLRVPTPGGDMPGPILPLAGRTAATAQSGFGLNLGVWLDSRNTRGIDASLFTLSGGDSTFTGFAPAMLVLFPNGTDRSAPRVIVLPDGTPIVGLFPATLSTWFITADVNYRHNLYCDPNARLDVLAGYRYAFMQDELFLGDSPSGSHDDYLRNRLAVSNPFHGGQIGLAGEYRGERLFVAGNAKVAFGAVSPELCATGMFRGAEGETTTGFARLATLGNTGGSRFAVLPTLNVRVGTQVREHARLFVGYTFQYLSQVARLGDALNPAATSLAMTDFWVQSFNLGFELRY
jgi:Putative beta barrel porin-7 (BBP7)